MYNVNMEQKIERMDSVLESCQKSVDLRYSSLLISFCEELRPVSIDIASSISRYFQSDDPSSDSNATASSSSSSSNLSNEVCGILVNEVPRIVQKFLVASKNPLEHILKILGLKLGILRDFDVLLIQYEDGKFLVRSEVDSLIECLNSKFHKDCDLDYLEIVNKNLKIAVNYIQDIPKAYEYYGDALDDLEGAYIYISGIDWMAEFEWNFAAGGVNRIFVPNVFEFTEAHKQLWSKVKPISQNIYRDYKFRAQVTSLHELIHLFQSPVLNPKRTRNHFKREYEASYGNFNLLYSIYKFGVDIEEWEFYEMLLWHYNLVQMLHKNQTKENICLYEKWRDSFSDERPISDGCDINDWFSKFDGLNTYFKIRLALESFSCGRNDVDVFSEFLNLLIDDHIVPDSVSEFVYSKRKYALSQTFKDNHLDILASPKNDFTEIVSSSGYSEWKCLG